MNYERLEFLENYWDNMETNFKKSKMTSRLGFIKKMMFVNDNFTAYNKAMFEDLLKPFSGDDKGDSAERYQNLLNKFDRILCSAKIIYDEGSEPTDLDNLILETNLDSGQEKTFSLDYFSVVTKPRVTTSVDNLFKNKFSSTIVTLDENDNPVVLSVDDINDNYLYFRNNLELINWLLSIKENLELIESNQDNFVGKVYAYMRKSHAEGHLVAPLVVTTSKVLQPSKVKKEYFLQEIKYKGELSGMTGNKFQAKVNAIEICGDYFRTKARVVILK